MADATLADVVKKLDQVKSAVKAGDKVTAGAAAKSEEADTEKARDDAELKKIFEAIRDKLGLKGGGKDDDDEGIIDSFSHNIVAALAGAAAGIVAGLTLGFIDFYKGIFKLAGKGFAKMFPNITKTLSGIFGKGGTISKFFMSIKTFFAESKVFKAISEGFTKFKTMLSNFGKTIKGFVQPIIKAFQPIMKLFGGGGGIGKGFKQFFSVFKRFFTIFKGFFKVIFKPLAIIIAVIEGFFEAKDAAGKSEGMMATFFNSIIGFFGGVLDSLVFGMMDLIKDAVSWVAGFFGFTEVEKFLDSFSFSDMFNEFLDDIYKWFNLLFSDPVTALTKLVSGIFGGILSIGDFIVDMIKKPIVWLLELFGWDDAAATTESFSFSGLVMGIFDKAKEWLGSMFEFDSASGLLKTVMNIMLWIPNLFVKAVAGIASWFAGLLGFDEKAKEISTAGKEFSFGGLIMDGLKALGNWLAGFLGFENIVPFLDSFSFSDMFNEFLDSIYEWFNILFSDPGAALVQLFAGFFGGILSVGDFIIDMLKKPIVWIMGIFGWDDAAEATEKFSFSGTVMKVFDSAVAWIKGIFADPVEGLISYFGTIAAGIGTFLDFITAPLKKAVVWVLKLFGWDEAAEATETFSFKGTIMGVFDKAVAWIKGIFADPVAGLIAFFATIAGTAGTFLDFVTAPLKKAVAWVLGLFGWDEAAEAAETFSFKGTIMGVFDKAVAWVKSLFAWGKAAGATEEGGWSLLTFVDGVWKKVKEWFSSLLSWASTEDEKDSWIVKTIKGVVKTVKEWFGNMFKFDTGSDVLKSILNIMMWIPNLLVKAMLGVTSFVAGLLGFDEKSEAIATAGKDFSFGDLIGDGLKALGDWLKGLFDIDVDAIGKSLLGDTVYNALFGGGGKSRKALEAAGIKQGATDFGGWDVDLGDLRKSLEGMNREQMELTLKNMKGLASAGQIENTQEVADLFSKMMPKIATGGAEGGIVGMSPLAAGALGKSLGLESGGVFTLSQGEMVLDNQAAEVFLKAAQLLTGSQSLEQSRSDGGGGPPVIVNNNNVDNSVKSNSRQNISVPESVRQNESTLRALQAA